MVNLSKYKNKYDAIAYIKVPNTNYKLYYRSPTISEFISYTENNTDIDMQIDCIHNCVFYIEEEYDEVDIKILDEVLDSNPNLVVRLYELIIELSPLSSKDKSKDIYKERLNLSKSLIYELKYQFLTILGSYELADKADTFSFKKLMDYVIMLEKSTGLHGVVISELTGDESFIPTDVKIELEKAKKKLNNTPNNKPSVTEFPKTIDDSSVANIKDPELAEALSRAQLALKNKIIEDKVLQERGQLKKTLDWESENKHETI